MLFKKFIGALAAVGAAAFMAVGVQAAEYRVEGTKGEAGTDVTVPVVVLPDENETVSINGYAMTFTYNPNLARPVIAGSDVLNEACYATVGGDFNTQDSIFVSGIMQTDTDEAKIVVAWASANPVEVDAKATMSEVIFNVDEAVEGAVDIKVTAGTLVADSGSEAEDIIDSMVSGSIDLSSFLRGDADGNGEVEAADAALILQSLVDLAEISEENKAKADADGNGEVEAADAALILQSLVDLAVISK